MRARIIASARIKTSTTYLSTYSSRHLHTPPPTPTPFKNQLHTLKPPLPASQKRTMTSTAPQPRITNLQKSDYDEWARLFRAYIDFYKASIPEIQYQRTFERLLDPGKDLYGLALRDTREEGKLLGIAHFYPHQTPWSEKSIMHFNGMLACVELVLSSSIRSLERCST